MALTSAEVRVAVSGEISIGLVSATYPATTAAALTGFAGSGYLSEDGLEESAEVTRETIKAWQNSATVRESITEAKLSYSGTLIQTNVANVEAYYATEVTQTADHGSYTISPGSSSGRKKFVIDIIDGAEKKRVMFEGELFKGDDAITYANGEAIGYPFVITAYTDPLVLDTALKTPA